MSFRYSVSTSDGKLLTGISDLPSREAVIEDLSAKGQIVIAVEPTSAIREAAKRGRALFGSVSQVDRVLFTKHLSIMLKAGLTLVECLDILEGQAASWKIRSIMHHLSKKVQRGDRFSDGLEDFPKVFTDFYVNIVRAGEVSGNLQENLEHLAEQFTKEYELGKKVKSALTYPAIVLAAAAGIGFFFATYVIPQVAGLFKLLKGVKLPLVTQILLKVAEITRKHTLVSFLTVFGGGYGVIWFVRRKFLAPITHKLILKMPIVGRISQNVNIARFSLVLGALLKSGIDITTCMRITSTVVSNVYYRRALAQVVDDIERGSTMSQSLLHHPDLFPKIVAKMVDVGERSGKLEEVLEYLSEFYDLEVESTLKNLAVVLEPVLLLFIGGIALAMAFAILIPIYNFITAIRNI